MIIEVEQQDDVCVLRVEGSFMTGGDPEYLSARKDDLKRLNHGKVLVDLRQMPYIGSTGIGFIVGIFTSVTVNAGQFVLVGLQPRVLEIFRATRLSTIIPSSPDIISGLAFLRAEASRVGAAESFTPGADSLASCSAAQRKALTG
jgi:anti-anti-sigma factor